VFLEKHCQKTPLLRNWYVQLFASFNFNIASVTSLARASVGKTEIWITLKMPCI